jgi:heme A synthase
LLSGVELWIAASHQAMAALLLAAALVAAHRLGDPRTARPAPVEEPALRGSTA